MGTRAKARKSKGEFSVRRLREEYDLSQATMARLLDVSVRTVASLEADEGPRPVPRSVHEVRRLLEGLADVMRPQYIRTWLAEPNQALGGLKPIEVVERGEVDRIWEIIYRLGSGELT